jgi:hypothetical protein
MILKIIGMTLSLLVSRIPTLMEKMMKLRTQVSVALLSGIGCLGLAVAADQSPVAKLVRLDGTAVISQGARYVPAHEGMSLTEGDRLMVLEGGSAILAFTDGCQYELGQMNMLAVHGISTCAAAGAGVYKVDPKSAVADGTPPKPQLAAMAPKPQSAATGGNVNKARSKAQCDAAASNGKTEDDCDCEERRNNDEKEDDCPPVAAWGVGGAAVAGTSAGGGLVTAGVFAVAAGTAAAVASSNKSNGSGPNISN